MKLTGFGWNDIDKIITASKEAWEEMILKEKSIKDYRDKVLASWCDLQELYQDSTANGFAAFSSKGKGISSKDQSQNHNIDAINLSYEHDHTGRKSPESPFITNLDEDEVSPTQTLNVVVSQDERNGKRSKSTPPKQHTKKQKRPIENDVSAIDKLAEASSQMYAVKRELVDKAEACSVRRCFEVLRSMDIDDPMLKIKAAKAFENDRKREVFIKMDADLRKIWLEYL